MAKGQRRISGRVVGSTVFSVIDFDQEYYGRDLDALVRREIQAWLKRYDGYEIYSVAIIDEPEDDNLGTVLVVRGSSFVGKTNKLVANPDLWDIDISQSFQGSLRRITGQL